MRTIPTTRARKKGRGRPRIEVEGAVEAEEEDAGSVLGEAELENPAAEVEEGVEVEGDGATTCDASALSASQYAGCKSGESYGVPTGNDSSTASTRRLVREDVLLGAVHAKAPRLVVARSCVVTLPDDVRWRVVGAAAEAVSCGRKRRETVDGLEWSFCSFRRLARRVSRRAEDRVDRR
jgi:hypothetical protein